MHRQRVIINFNEARKIFFYVLLLSARMCMRECVFVFTTHLKDKWNFLPFFHSTNLHIFCNFKWAKFEIANFCELSATKFGFVIKILKSLTCYANSSSNLLKIFSHSWLNHKRLSKTKFIHFWLCTSDFLLL